MIGSAAEKEEPLHRSMNSKQRKALWESGYVHDSLFGVRADNITPMTVTGTNTFIVHTPGTPDALVVDPGPADVNHLRNVMSACEKRGARIAGILLTHHHLDHIEGTDLLRYLVEHGANSVEPNAVPPALSGARFWYDAERRYPKVAFPEPGVPVFHPEMGNLPEGPFVPFEGAPAMEVFYTPGHSSESVSVLLADEKSILTGDVIFRFWSTVIPYGDGNLGDYFETLDKLQHLVRAGKAEQFVPAHGFPIDQPIKALEGYRAHRRERLEEVRRAVDAGTGYDAAAVVQAVYGDVIDDNLLFAAMLATVTQLEYLAAQRGVPYEPDLSFATEERVTRANTNKG